MIRVFARATVPAMDIVELQGKVLITEEALGAAREAKERRRASQYELHPSGEDTICSAVGEEAAGVDSDTRSPSSVSSSSYLSSSCCSSTCDEDRERDPTTGVSSEVANLGMCGFASHTGAGAAASYGTSSSAQASSAARRAALVKVPLGYVEGDHLSEKRCTLCIDTLRVHGSRSKFKRPWLVLRECTPARVQHLRRRIAHRPVEYDHPHACALQAIDGDGRGGASAAESAGGEPLSSSSPPPEKTVLFSDWLRQHPDALSLNSIFLDDMASGEENGQGEDGQSEADPARPESIVRAAGGTSHAIGAHKRPREVCCGDDMIEESGSSSPQSRLRAKFEAPEVQAPGATAYKNYELVGVVRGSVLFNSKPARVFHSRK